MSQAELISKWNQQHTPGIYVKYRRKTGNIGIQTTTRSAAFLAPNGQAVIRLTGMAGLYPLEALTVAEVKVRKDEHDRTRA